LGHQSVSDPKGNIVAGKQADPGWTDNINIGEHNHQTVGPHELSGLSRNLHSAAFKRVCLSCRDRVTRGNTISVDIIYVFDNWHCGHSSGFCPSGHQEAEMTQKMPQVEPEKPLKCLASFITTTRMLCNRSRIHSSSFCASSHQEAGRNTPSPPQTQHPQALKAVCQNVQDRVPRTAWKRPLRPSVLLSPGQLHVLSMPARLRMLGQLPGMTITPTARRRPWLSVFPTVYPWIE
jgi:hypothetical protein